MSTEHTPGNVPLNDGLGLAPERAAFEAWLDKPVAAGEDPAPWLDGLAPEAAWQAWKHRGAEIERLRDLVRRALPMATALDATRTAVVWTADLQVDATMLVRDMRAALKA